MTGPARHAPRPGRARTPGFARLAVPALLVLIAVAAIVALAALTRARRPAPAEPLATGLMAFGVFGDGPYSPFDRAPYRRLLEDVAETDIAFLVHVGDITGSDCSDALYRARRRDLDALPVPVIYTPGDNEWTDCHEVLRPDGRPWDPLERLDALRRIFFDQPDRSLGRATLPLVSQAGEPAPGDSAATPAFPGLVENARWTVPPLLAATVHLPGSENGTVDFPGRTAAHDSAAARRVRAAGAWIDRAFEVARRDSARLVVLAMQTSLWDDWPDGTLRPRGANGDVAYHVHRGAAGFPGTTLVVHGDWHEYRVDHPGHDSMGRALPTVTRLMTFGSPDIGWVRVVVDTATGRIVRFEPRRMKGWW